MLMNKSVSLYSRIPGLKGHQVSSDPAFLGKSPV